MSGKKPILNMAPGMARIHSSPIEVQINMDSGKPGTYHQFFGGDVSPGAQIPTISTTVDPRALKKQEAEGYLNDIVVDPASANKFAYSQHHPIKPSLSVGSRVLYLPNLTTDKPSSYKMTCTKSVHKVVFLFCSVTLAIVIACIIFVEMKKMQMMEEEQFN